MIGHPVMSISQVASIGVAPPRTPIPGLNEIEYPVSITPSRISAAAVRWEKEPADGNR
jgi:hypothetical protein